MARIGTRQRVAAVDHANTLVHHDFASIEAMQAAVRTVVVRASGDELNAMQAALRAQVKFLTNDERTFLRAMYLYLLFDQEIGSRFE
jgi:hypothetical protein